MESGPVSHVNWKDDREQARSFSGMLGFDWAGMSVATGGEASLIVGQLVSENYFELLGVRPERGRAFTAEEGARPGAHPVAVVSHHFWQQRLAGDPPAGGRPLRVHPPPFTVLRP